MKKYKIEVLNEVIECKASSISAAVSKALKQLQKRKIFKDKVDLWIIIDVERVK